ncbi:hypothetical protein MRB53_030468 [Persea americana]|uniref:Uncharacterized protein n=1 Tax=Persea americana TaxID=3435 RepID=A0ACC2KLB6_PERAE|nr:hypothetical protein MRB53_030468 [Persea americana]
MAARKADTPEEDRRQSEQTQVRRERVVLEEEPEEPKKDPKPTMEPEKPIGATSPTSVTAPERIEKKKIEALVCLHCAPLGTRRSLLFLVSDRRGELGNGVVGEARGAAVVSGDKYRMGYDWGWVDGIRRAKAGRGTLRSNGFRKVTSGCWFGAKGLGLTTGICSNGSVEVGKSFGTV